MSLMDTSIKSQYVFHLQQKMIVEKKNHQVFTFSQFKRHIKQHIKDLEFAITETKKEINQNTLKWPEVIYSDVEVEMMKYAVKNKEWRIREWESILRNIQNTQALGETKEERSLNVAAAKLVPITNFVEVVHHNKALCPFHNEKTPSFLINKNNTYKCFGCDEYGDVINLVQKMYGWSFVEAVRMLNRDSLQ